MRLIDADALKEKMKGTYRYFTIKYDIDEAPTIDAVSRDVYDKRTKADEEIIDSYREKLANCHKEILRLLDFNDITESPNDDIEPQNDVIEVVRCKDCRHANECHKSVQYTRNGQNTTTIGFSPIEWCSRGERKGGDDD